MKHENSNNRYKNIILAFVLVSIVAVTFYVGKQFSNTQAPQQTQMATAVKVVKLKKETIQQSLQLPGRVNAVQEAQVRPQVSGIVTDILFTQGAKVKKGEQLYQIDPTPYEAVYNSALADLKKAKAKRDRFKELVDINAVSQQEYDDAEASFAQAQAAAQVAKVDLDYTKVYAPIDGFIGKTNVTIGALVNTNQEKPLTHITQTQPVYIDLSIPAEDYLKVRSQFDKGESLNVNLSNGVQLATTATVNFAETIVDPSTGTVNVRSTSPNPNTVLLPGMFTRAEIQLKPQETVLVPHKASVRTPEGKLTVWKLDTSSNTVSPTPITVTGAYNNSWIVQSGVKPGDIIVSEGFQKIQPGAQVTPEMANDDKKSEDKKKTVESK